MAPTTTATATASPASSQLLPLAAPPSLSSSLGPLTPPPTPPKSAPPASPTPSRSPYHRLQLPRQNSGGIEARALTARAKEELEGWVRERGRAPSADEGSPGLEGDREKVIGEAVEWLRERKKSARLVSLG